MINDNSNIQFVFRDYAIKKIFFVNFLKNKTIQLDKNGALVTHEEYKRFYESIRNCTR